MSDTAFDRQAEMDRLRAELSALEGESNAATIPAEVGAAVAAPTEAPVIAGAPTAPPEAVTAPPPLPVVPVAGPDPVPPAGALASLEVVPAAVPDPKPAPTPISFAGPVNLDPASALREAVRRIAKGQVKTEEELQEVLWLVDGRNPADEYQRIADEQRAAQQAAAGVTHVQVTQ